MAIDSKDESIKGVFYKINKKNALKITSRQIKKYESLAAERGLSWTKIN